MAREDISEKFPQYSIILKHVLPLGGTLSADIRRRMKKCGGKEKTFDVSTSFESNEGSMISFFPTTSSFSSSSVAHIERKRASSHFQFSLNFIDFQSSPSRELSPSHIDDDKRTLLSAIRLINIYIYFAEVDSYECAMHSKKSRWFWPEFAPHQISFLYSVQWQ